MKVTVLNEMSPLNPSLSELCRREGRKTVRATGDGEHQENKVPYINMTHAHTYGLVATERGSVHRTSVHLHR